MAGQFLAEIRVFGFNFPPLGWMNCDGQLLPISQYTAVFSLIGTYYGGNGTSNFALPNLQGMAPLASGQGPGLSLYDLGETGGSQNVTVLSTAMPSHNHPLTATTTQGTTTTASPNQLAKGLGGSKTAANVANIYSTKTTGLTALAPQSITPAGGSSPHNNMMPYLTLNFCIALTGIFPPRS